MAAAAFQAVEETGSCGEAWVMGQRQLVDGGLGGLQSRTGAPVSLVQRPVLGSPVGRRAVAVAGTRCPLRPGRPLPPKPLRRVRGVRLQRQDVRGLTVAILARADGAAGPAPEERHTNRDEAGHRVFPVNPDAVVTTEGTG